MLRPLTAAIAALGVALSVGACDAKAAETDRLTACDLVTRRQVERTIGRPVTAPETTVDEGADALAGRSGCAWSSRDGQVAALFELIRTPDMAGTVRRTGFSAWSRFNAAAARHDDASPEELGDRSFWVEHEATMHLLVAGQSYLVVEVAVASPAQARRLARDLAQPAVARLTALDGQTDAEDE